MSLTRCLFLSFFAHNSPHTKIKIGVFDVHWHEIRIFTVFRARKHKRQTDTNTHTHTYKILCPIAVDDEGAHHSSCQFIWPFSSWCSKASITISILHKSNNIRTSFCCVRVFVWRFDGHTKYYVRIKLNGKCDLYGWILIKHAIRTEIV